MSRAVVLGGGGPVGIGWEAGLLVGLAESGVVTHGADAVVGTSAGSVVGFTLASGGDLTQATSLVAGAASTGGGTDAADPVQAQGLEQLMATVAEAAADPAGAEAARARLGRIALDADTIPVDTWLGLFSAFAGAPWPPGFACTAVSASDGRFQVWDESTGVDPQLALASSCAVPAIFPPVPIDDDRWIDGGVRDMLNVDVAAGHDLVLAVSCTVLELPEGFAIPTMEAIFAATRAQIRDLEVGGTKVATVVPSAEMLELSGWGMNLMDFNLAAAAYEAGVRQGRSEAGRVGAVWS